MKKKRTKHSPASFRRLPLVASGKQDYDDYDDDVLD